jgi:hypothetical protein
MSGSGQLQTYSDQSSWSAKCEQTSKGYDQGYGGIDGDLPREPHRRKARERSALPVSEAAYEGGEFL